MSTYLFETDQFGIYDEGIHLLRSKFNYESIPFKNVNEIILEKGKQVNNWIVLTFNKWCYVKLIFQDLT